MYKLLPWRKLFLWIGIVIVFFLGLSSFVKDVLAYEPPLGQPTGINWAPDDEVTFVGRSAVRSKDFLDWTLTNYQWSYADIDKTQGQNTQPQYSLQNMWVTIRNITYALLILFVIVSAALLIITAGKNTGILVFLRKFFFAVAFITLAFALIQIIYQIADILQGFFLKPPITHGRIIGVADLLNISFHYNFLGYRAIGGEYKESAFIGLLLTRLTAITYNTMSALLLLRKVILWFFIAVSPIFPLLFLYRPLNNTGKIWLGEFFRWTLYGPLFCMFLSGLVWLWNAKILLLPFNLNAAGIDSKIVYPTAINILLGGPGLSLNYLNNLNYNDTYVQYLLALLMLWAVIILPFILLRIFLDLFMSMYEKNNPLMFLQSLGKTPPVGEPMQRHTVTPPVAPAPLPMKPQPTGKAMEIPTASSISQRNTNIVSNVSGNQQNVSRISHVSSISNATSITKTSAYGIHNMPIPTMQDIARFETNKYSSQSKSSTNTITSARQEVEHIQETLRKIANPQSANATERPTFMHIQSKLAQSSRMGDPVATSIITAASVMAGKSTKTTTAKAGATDQGQTGSPSDQTTPTPQSFPTVNKVQSVNLDDYEAVRDTWYKNYMNMEPPAQANGQPQSREAWLHDEITKTDRAVELITSHNPQDVKSGMEMVSQLLPFLLVGGFSQTEVIAYLKAKRKAGESALSAIEQKQKEEDTQVLVETKQQEETKHMQAEEPETKPKLDEKEKIPS